MPAEDAVRWNTRYQQEPRESYAQPRAFLVQHASWLPAQGLALDVAMGLGGNAGFLLERGLRVIGLDIAEVAVRQARARYPELTAAVVDLTRMTLPESRFDVILNFFYLQRDLWPVYARALRPGGLLFYETLTRDMLEIHPEVDPVYLLGPGELRSGFPGLEVLHYSEGWVDTRSDHQRAVASLLARAPGSK
jgi:SAM-dependent methyltransferase